MSDWYRVSRPLGAIDPDERGFQYGDGVFETVAVRKGEPRLWSHHVRVPANVSDSSARQ